MSKIKTNELPLVILLALSILAVGGFYSVVSVFLSVALCAMLIVRLSRQKNIKVGINLSMIFALVFSLGYLTTTLWAVDKYNSVLGFVKFLPVMLFGAYISQIKKEDRENALSVVAPLGVLMTVVSFALSRIPSLAHLFSVSGRISGFFEYSNTFALFLIIGIILIGTREKLSAVDMLMAAVLIAGVFLTGSRTSFIILIIAILALAFVSRNKGFKLGVIGIIVVGIVGAIIYASVTGKYGAFGRFLTISAGAGTLQGRILYFKDAIRVIAKHPFGLGYMGYYFLQPSFQTGVYSNQFVHNEFLQILLDIGWIPAALGVACVASNLISKNISIKNKLIIGIAVIHSMMDFDFQFLGVLFVVMLCLDFDSNQKELEFKKPIKIISIIIAIIISVVSIYLGASDFCYLISKNEMATKLCSHNTMAQIELLQDEENISTKREIADTILEGDKYISNAYSSIALYYYNDGDIEKTIRYKEMAIENSRYFIDEYQDYCYMLINTISIFSEMGEYESMSYCIDHLKWLDEKIQSVKETTDDIAYKLNDKPNLELPAECQDFINDINNF